MPDPFSQINNIPPLVPSVANGDASCAGCVFFDPPKNKDFDGGECRRYAPRSRDQVYASWPGVRKESWCGEFVSRRRTR